MMEPNLVFYPYESDLEYDDNYNLYPLGLPHSKIAVKMYQDSVRAIRSNAVTNNIMNELLENRRNEDYYNWMDNKVSKYTACCNVIADEISTLYKRDDLDFEDWHYLLLYKKFSRILTERGQCSEETITSLIYNLVNLIRNDLNLRNLLILSSDDYVEVLLTRFVEMAMNEKIYDYEYSRPHMDEYKMKAIRKHLQRSTRAASKAHTVSKLWGWMDQDQIIPPPTPIAAPSRLNPENYYVYGRQMRATGTGESRGINIRDGCIPVPRVVFPHGQMGSGSGSSTKSSKGSKNTVPTDTTKSVNQEPQEKKPSRRYGPRGPYKRTVIKMRMREISRKRKIFKNKDDVGQTTEEETDYQNESNDSGKEESEVKNLEIEEQDEDKDNNNKENENDTSNTDITNETTQELQEDKNDNTENNTIPKTKTTNKRPLTRLRNTKLRSSKPIPVELNTIKDLMEITKNINKDISKSKELKDNMEDIEGENVDNKEDNNKEINNKNKSKCNKETDRTDNKEDEDVVDKELENMEKEDKLINDLVAKIKTELPKENMDMFGIRNGNYQNSIDIKSEAMFDRELACPIELNRYDTSNNTSSNSTSNNNRFQDINTNGNTYGTTYVSDGRFDDNYNSNDNINAFDPYPGYKSNYLNHLPENEVQKNILGKHIIDHNNETPKGLTCSPSSTKDFETISDLYKQFNMDYSGNSKSMLSSDGTSDEYSSPNLIIGMNRNMKGFQESNVDMGLFEDVLDCNLVYYKGDEDMIGYGIDSSECEVSPIKRIKKTDPFHSKPIPDNINNRRRSSRLNGRTDSSKDNRNGETRKDNKEDNKRGDNNNNNKDKINKENEEKELKEKDHEENRLLKDGHDKRKGDDTIWDMVQKHQKSGSGNTFNITKPPNNNNNRDVPEDKDDMSLLIREHYHVSENVPSSQTQPYINAYKTPKSIKWSYTDTKRFYNAIETFGTDLLLVRAYLPEYTDRQVYDKFKLEERKNPQLMQNALQTHKCISLKQYEQKYGKIDTNTHYNPLKDPLLQEETQLNKNTLKLNINNSNGITTESHQKVDDKIINLFM